MEEQHSYLRSQPQWKEMDYDNDSDAPSVLEDIGNEVEDGEDKESEETWLLMIRMILG